MAQLKPRVLRYDSLPSTNTEAASQALKGAAEGLCIVALEQTAGRGRLQRQWLSPAGAGLYLSIVLRPKIEIGVWPLITLMAAVVVRDALLAAYAVETDIKWPNDILVGDQKLCGILAETIDTDRGRAVIVGIGINLNAVALPLARGNSATSVEAVTGSAPDPEELLHALFHLLEKHYGVLQSAAGPEEIVRAWCARSSYASGKRVRISSAAETLEGLTRGLESDGALRVETDGGEIKTFRTGDVTTVRPAGNVQT